jgi:adenylate kinase family enzyme
LKIIGLSGRAGAGKTTISKHLVEHFGYTRMAFGDPLKEMLIKAGLCTWEECYVEKTARSRELLQKVGTEIFRKQIHTDFWVQQIALRVKERPVDSKIVFDDLRFPNEAKWIRSFPGSMIVKLERIGHVDATAGTTHESESLVDTIQADHTITAASGEVDELLMSIEQILGS